MELIHIALTEVGRRSRSVELTHAEAGLELGGKVAIADQAVGEVSRRLADIPGTRVPRSGGGASPAG